MTFSFKKIRFLYWFTSSFARKHIKQLSISAIVGFFLLILVLNISPYINSYLFRNKEIIGIVSRSTISSMPISLLQEISSPLVSINEKGEIVPVLAHSWEIMDKGTRYRFHLKSNLYWSDQKPFVCKDIIYSFKDIKINCIDDMTIEFKLSQQLVIFPYYLTKPLIKSSFIGIGGIYNVQNVIYKKGYIHSINLSANKKALPYKIYKFYATEDELLTAYKKGQITSFATNSNQIASIFADWKNTRVNKNTNYDQILTLLVNVKNPILSSKDIRKAIYYSLPSFSEYGIKANSPIPPTSWAYEPDIKTYSLNREKAKSLLEKNISATQEASLKLYTFYEQSTIAQDIKDNISKTGFNVTIKYVSYRPKDFDLLLTLWTPPRDPDQYFFWHSTQTQTNITNYVNLKVDKLLEDGRKIINPSQRKKIYKEFQTTIADEAPAIFLYYPYTYIIERK